jgi:hypothetical protein
MEVQVPESNSTVQQVSYIIQNLCLMSVEGSTGPRIDWLLDCLTAALAARTKNRRKNVLNAALDV